MNKRKPIQTQHEKSFINRFLCWLHENTGEQFKVLERPNPPDAIIGSDYRTSWVEACNTFYPEGYAQDIWSRVTPGEIYKPMPKTFQQDIDLKFAECFADSLKDKLSKESYSEYVKKYGQGYLIIGMQSPWFDETTKIYMRRECEARNFENKGSFNKIFIEYCHINKNAFQEWHL